MKTGVTPPRKEPRHEKVLAEGRGNTELVVKKIIYKYQLRSYEPVADMIIVINMSVCFFVKNIFLCRYKHTLGNICAFFPFLCHVKTHTHTHYQFFSFGEL